MFYRIKQALYRFMYGRYGTDNLNRAMLVLYIVIIAARFITMIFSDSVAAALVFETILWALIIIIFYRMLSRNVYKRSQENAVYLKIRNRFYGHIKAFFNGIGDRSKKYAVCPACSAVIRFPRKKGVHSARCPKCGAAMTVKVR